MKLIDPTQSYRSAVATCTLMENGIRSRIILLSLFLIGLFLSCFSNEALAQPTQVITRALGGEPNPSWDVPTSRIFDSAKPGVDTPETDAPFSANTNQTLDVWSGADSPGNYPAYYTNNGPAAQSPRIAPPQFSLYRNLVASDPISLGSFGPNQFCAWDTKLYIYSQNDAEQYASNAIMLDGSLSRQLLFVDQAGYPGGAEHMIEDETREYSRLIADSGNTMSGSDPRNSVPGFVHPLFTNTSNPGSAIVEKFDGGKLYFELVHVGNFLRGRLTTVEDRYGSKISITYRVARTALNSGNIDSMWQIHSIYDRFGAAYTFNYGSSQHAGRWCVESIDMLNQGGGSVQYTYGSTTDSDPHNDGKLESVTYADGNTASYEYGVDVDSNPTIAWSDPASVGTFGREIIAHVSGTTQTQNGELANQPSGALVKVMSRDTNGDPDETRLQVTYLTYPELLIEYGGTVMKLTAGGEKRYATQATDPCNHLEPVYATNTYGSKADLLQGKFTQVVDSRGQVYHYQFDSVGFPIKKIYDQGQSYETFEEWTYGAFYNVTRYRDREGRVTRFVYGTKGELLERQVGILDVAGVDTNQAEYAVYKYEYFPAGHINEYMLKTEFTPLHTGQADIYRMDYVYDDYNRLIQKIGSAEQTGQTRPVTIWQHDLLTAQNQRRTSVQDPEGRKTFTNYDVANRSVMRIHPDGSWDTTNYGVPGIGPSNAAQKVVSTRDRTGSTDYYSYDHEGRLYVLTEASNATSQQGKFITSFIYYPDSALLKHINRDSRTTKYEYDYRARKTLTRVYPYDNKTLTTTKVYLENRLHYIEDPYGRRKYVAYNENGNRTKIRILQYNRPYTQTNPPVDRAAVLALGRVTTANPPYSIKDIQLDHSDNLLRVTDGRDIPLVLTYDSRNRQKSRIQAAGISGFHFQATTDYNADNTVSAVQLPRYYDSADSNGHQVAEQQFSYNGRTLLSQRSIAINGTTDAEMDIAYHLDNRVDKYTDERDYDWFSDWDNNGRLSGMKNPQGHGRFSVTDFEGRVTHGSLVAQYDVHGNTSDPDNDKTRREITARYDGLDRLIASTTWLGARDVVDPNAPPIAGLDGIGKNSGLTSQYIYDTRLFDGLGLDSAAGIQMERLGGGFFNVNVQACLNKLAEPVSSGGAGVTFSAGRSGGATVAINGEEEILVRITDAIGREVMLATLEGPHGSSPNSLITWKCTVHDTLSNLVGFGNLLETRYVDPLGNYSSQFTDGGGRLLKSRDTLGNISLYQVDADGHQLSFRDANDVGFDSVFDALGRLTSRTDTYGTNVQWAYDRGGNVIEWTDAKSNTTTNQYDAADRLVSTTNRINGVNTYTYDLAGNMTSMTDAENRTTSYWHNPVGLNTVITYPDHVNGAAVGNVRIWKTDFWI